MSESTRPVRRRLAGVVARAVAGLVAALALPLTPALAGSVAPTEPGELLLVLRSADAVTPLISKYGLSLVGRFGARPIFRLRVVGGADVDKAVADLALEPDVLVAEQNFRHASPESVKNNVWAIGTAQAYAAQWAAPAIGLASARGLATGAGVRVAVLDTGFDLSHPALAGHWLPGRDFVDGDTDPSEAAQPTQAGYGHGSHVAGLVAWVAPGAKIMPLRVLDADGGGNTWVLAEALLHAVDPDHNPATDDGAQVINLSLAGLQRTRLMDTITQIVGCGVPDPANPLVDLRDAGYNDDHARCGSHGGAVVVVGAGNDGSSSLRTWPAAESAYGLLAVAASAANGKLAPFSNSGGWIQIAAPGDALTSSVPGGHYATWSGTSMAAPLVAGAAALVRERFPQLEARDVSRCLQASAQSLTGTRLRQVDVGRAMQKLAADPRSCR